MGREVIVVGAGIVGISLAHALAERGADVTVLDRDPHEPKGSTAFAPGFVGLYDDVPILTELARDSAAVYDTAPRGFRRSGGLELATSEEELPRSSVAPRRPAQRGSGPTWCPQRTFPSRSPHSSTPSR